MPQIFTQLADIARETGYPVIEVPGWTHHHHGAFSDHVGATVCHHTAGADPHQSRSNYPSLNAVRNGVPGLAGPLSNYGIGFDGTIYVISSGTCWHAGRGGWAGMRYNSQCIGIEAEDAGDGDWTAAQLDVYPRLCAVICQFLGVGANTVCGHKEWCEPPGRKIDPAGIDMRDFRGDVNWYLNNPNKIRKGKSSGGGGKKPAPKKGTPPPEGERYSDMGMAMNWLPQTHGEWNRAAFVVECDNSAVIERLWMTIGTSYGATDIVVIFEGGGKFHWPSWTNGAKLGKWDEGEPDFGTISSGRSARMELTPEMEVVSLHYRNHGGAVAGVSFPQLPK